MNSKLLAGCLPNIATTIQVYHYKWSTVDSKKFISGTKIIFYKENLAHGKGMKVNKYGGDK